MGARGPAPAPPSLRLLNGSRPGKGVDGAPVKPAPSFKRVPPTMPGWLSIEAQREWLRVLPELTRLDLVKEGDAAALAAYCEAWSEFVAASVILNQEGLIISGLHADQAHPMVAVRRAASTTLRQWVNHFGLSPSAENGISGRDAGSGEDNPFAGVG